MNSPLRKSPPLDELNAIDATGFAKAMTALRLEVNASLGPSDLAHMLKVERWGRLCTVLGYATAWLIPNPVSAYLISQGILTRWLMMHHVGHRGYDQVPGIPARYTSKVFALGWRRYLDWFDWILPEAWNYEHNVLHHYNTGERADPDLVERNVGFVRHSKGPRWLRYLYVVLLAATWKLSYYAPSTLLEYQNERRRRQGHPPAKTVSSVTLFSPLSAAGREFWLRCVLPYGLMRFLVVPALFLPLGLKASLFVFVNSVLAEVMTNVHSFCVIGPNHTGDDLYRFDEPIQDKTEFFARQVMGSVNYHCGTDRVDYLQAWLNYQIEHHLFPDLPMLKYQQYHARIRELCAQYGLRYQQDAVWKRVGKLVSIMVGKSSMLRIPALAKRKAA
jgi:fatty acid desaturase